MLPAASFLERSELHVHAMFQVVTLTDKLLPSPGVQDEYDFWHDLAHRLGAGEYFPWKDETALTRWLLEPPGLSLRGARRTHPEGVRRTAHPLREVARDEPLATPSGKVEFASQYLEDLGYPELPEYRPPAYRSVAGPRVPLRADHRGAQAAATTAASTTSSASPARDRDPEMEMHPDDAAGLGVADGDAVRVSSRVGTIELPVTVTAPNEILPGTVQITHGYRRPT